MSSITSQIQTNWERIRLGIELGAYRKAETLVWQVVNTYQSNNIQNVSSLISHITIEQGKIETASINLQIGHIVIDPYFFLKFIRTPEDLIFLVLHERQHCLIRYLLDADPRTPELNYVQDSYTNNHLNNLIASDLPERFYQGNPICLALTRNHEHLRYWLHFLQVEFADKVTDRLIFISKHANSDYRVWKQLFLPIAKKILSMDKTKQPGPVGEGKPTATPSQKDLLASHAIEHLDPEVQEKKALPGLLMGETTTYVDLSYESSYTISEEKYSQLVRLIANRNEGGKIEKPMGLESLTSLKTFLIATSSEQTFKAKSITPPMRPSNTDLMLLSAGHVPADFDVTLIRSGKKWSLFLDTSGSMTKYYPVLLAFAKQLHHLIDSVYQFASLVVKVDHRKETKIKVSGGTNFEAASRKMLSENLENVILVSDNQAALTESSKNRLKTSLRTLIFVPTPSAKPGAWFEVADEIFKL